MNFKALRRWLCMETEPETPQILVLWASLSVEQKESFAKVVEAWSKRRKVSKTRTKVKRRIK